MNITYVEHHISLMQELTKRNYKRAGKAVIYGDEITTTTGLPAIVGCTYHVVLGIFVR